MASGDMGATAITVLAAMLPTTLEAYRMLAEAPVADDPKLATAQQQACKAALMHLEALIKLIRLAEPASGTGETGPVGEAAELVARAQQAFDSYKGDDM